MLMCSYFCLVTHLKYTFKVNVLRYSNGGDKRSELERPFDVDENGQNSFHTIYYNIMICVCFKKNTLLIILTFLL